MEKILIVGSSSSGKTSLILRYVTGLYQSEYLQTFGAELYNRPSTDPKKLALNLWDCSGQERYRVLLVQFYADIQVALVCFESTVRSFQELPFWLSEVKKYKPDATIYLIGTKADLEAGVKEQEIYKLVSR